MSTIEVALHPYRAMGALILSELDHFDQLPERKKRFANPEDYRPGVVQALTTIQREVRKNEFATRAEPFIACLRLIRNGREEHLLISRNYAPDHDPVAPGCMFASYLSPMGSIASRALEQPFRVRVPAGEFEVTLLERSEFRSVRKHAWDAVQNEYAAGARLRVSIPSVRQLLAHPAPDGRDAAVQAGGAGESVEYDLSAEWGGMDNVDPPAGIAAEILYVRRVVPSVAAKVELRDRPILDDLQDPIFRLPVDSRMVLTGAAGTGKSTVLIKRLSQKTKGDFLHPDETAGLSGDQLDYLLDPARSWVLFTPNDLLRNYLKEALGREQLSATQETVRTWSDERTRLARDVLRILKVGGSKGAFTRTSGVVFELNDSRRQRLLSGYGRHCDERYRSALRSAARALETAERLCAEAERETWRDGDNGGRSWLPPEVLEFNHEYLEFTQRALGRIGDPTADPYETVMDLQKIRQEFFATRTRAEALGDKAGKALLSRVEGLRGQLPDVPTTEAPAR
ncbi:MAG TPA: hypothetical protein VGB15_19015 [Longimicrobium sp.]